MTNDSQNAIIKTQRERKREVITMIRNTYYKVMNEMDEVIATVETKTEAKKIAKKEAKSRKEMLWVIDVLNDNEVAVYDAKGNEW